MREVHNIIKKVDLTEKQSRLTEKQGKYFFRVAEWANKMEIKRAVEQLFSVKVRKVNTINYLGKRKRERSLHYGKRADWKRAIVTLQQGQKIELV